MASVAVNNFKTITHTLSTGPAEEIYTAPTGYTSVFLLLQVTNTDSTGRTVSLNHVRSSTVTELIKDFPIADTVCNATRSFKHEPLHRLPTLQA